MSTKTITFEELTEEVFGKQDPGMNYRLPHLKSGLCKYRVRDEEGDLLGKASSATNTHLTHSFEAGEAMSVTIREWKGDNKLVIDIPAPDDDGTVQWTLITEAGHMSLKIVTI